LELELTFSVDLGMESEAILATGDGRAMDVLLLMHDSPQQSHFVLKMAGGTILTGLPLRMDSTATHKVRVTWGGFYPDSVRPANVSPEEWRRRQHAVAVSVNGAPGLSGQADFVLAARQTVSIGQATAKAGAISGRLHGVRRLPLSAR
jgi:hypothetical protein